uniref:Uncharacterized protein n=1 Tax=Oryza brachyantha TaxID=4533 RepID=J3KWY9_ORYBR
MVSWRGGVRALGGRRGGAGAVGGGEGDRAGVEVVADVEVLLREVPEDGHRLLLRRRHHGQAQRPLLHHHERVFRLQRHRRAAA